MRRATRHTRALYFAFRYFNPRSPWGERLAYDDFKGLLDIFQSTLSVRRATYRRALPVLNHSYFNPRSPWGERRLVRLKMLLAGVNFNPRSPWGERLFNPRPINRHIIFQSTLSVRRATHILLDLLTVALFQSTLSVRRATRDFLKLPDVFKISIHALREESDAIKMSRIVGISIFQSTLSVRRATLHLMILTMYLILFQSTLSVRRATAFLLF